VNLLATRKSLKYFEVKRRIMDTPTNESELRVFVHLAHGFGRAAWKKKWDQGKIVGINHDDPYGYRQAEEMGCIVEQSDDYPEGRVRRLLRLGVRAILGFDLLHAWNNRKSIFGAEVVWTHTESQALAVLMLARISGSSAASTAMIAQTVWVMDSWESYSSIRRAVYRSLLRRADILTFLSPSAAAKARELFPDRRVEFIQYGIRADQSLAVIHREKHAPVRILSMGTDRHRDWSTLVAAIQNDSRYLAKAVTGAKIDGLLANVTNITRERAATNDALLTLLNWADIVVVCLVENLHASGITVIEEAVLCGVPVIATDAGGLRSYFSPEEITYIPPKSPQALRSAIDLLIANDELRQGRAKRALTRMKDGDLNSRSFVARHVELSNGLRQARRMGHISETLSVAAER
jgi:glycosyltransferase involved in cell wall biosynthesis